jgi:uncharacterized protein (TIGR02421 family)
MAKSHNKAQLVALIREANDAFRHCSRRLKILSAISWNAKVAHEFFRKKEGSLPNPTYHIDRTTVASMIDLLEGLTPKLKAEHPVYQWLYRTQQSYILAGKLLLAVETDQFSEISTELYGNSESRLFKGNISNIDLANSISARMSVCALNDIAESIVLKSADQFSGDLEKKLKARIPILPVRVEITDEIAAKAVAGMNRIRVRRDARFSELEVTALWHHEIESHCLTANNGILQENCDFLCAGGPRTTMTQEGLAVFFEMYGHSMSQRRFLALCERVQATQLAEKGADFMEVFRWYKERADNETEAFFSAQRVFRGAKLTGGHPFTKDTVYLAGLLGIYNFLRIAVKNQNRLLVESLICGRMALEDVGTVTYLRTHGILQPPRYLPAWLENWEALLSSFSFSAFLNSIDLSAYQDYFDTQNNFQKWDFSL